MKRSGVFLRVARHAPALLIVPLAVLAGGLVACGDGSAGDPPPTDERLVFPRDLARSDYVQVRPCRAPGEHSALAGFTVWVDGEGAAAFEDLWADPPGLSELPDGTVVVKVVYDGSDCAPDDAAGWFAMEKRSGFDPEGGDWYWQEVAADGTLRVDGKDSACTGCHEGGSSTTCTGYGAFNGRDYVCTEP